MAARASIANSAANNISFFNFTPPYERVFNDVAYSFIHIPYCQYLKCSFFLLFLTKLNISGGNRWGQQGSKLLCRASPGPPHIASSTFHGDSVRGWRGRTWKREGEADPEPPGSASPSRVIPALRRLPVTPQARPYLAILRTRRPPVTSKAPAPRASNGAAPLPPVFGSSFLASCFLASSFLASSFLASLFGVGAGAAFGAGEAFFSSALLTADAAWL